MRVKVLHSDCFTEIRPANYLWMFIEPESPTRCFPMDIDADSVRLLRFYRRKPSTGVMFGEMYGYDYGDWNEIKHLFDEPEAPE